MQQEGIPFGGDLNPEKLSINVLMFHAFINVRLGFKKL